MLQCGFFPWGTGTEPQIIDLERTPKDHQVQVLTEWPLWEPVLQEEAAAARVPHGITNPASKPPPVHPALPMETKAQPPAASL